MFLAPKWRGRPAGFVAFLATIVLFCSIILPATVRASAQSQQKRLYLWVVRYVLEDTVAFTALADSARSVGVTDLLVQVRGRGDAYYHSWSEPAPRSLETELPPGVLVGDRPSEESLRFDPLGAAIRIAGDRGLRVHAWFNLYVTGSWKPKERRARHVLVQHPEWQISLKNGRMLEDLSESEWRNLKLEGIFLDPGHPRVIAYLRGLVRELLWRYALDGIHFDYIRYPLADAGYGDESRMAFLDARHTGEIPEISADPDVDPWDAWRIGRISKTVESLSRVARVTAPAVEVSAAVMPDPLGARRSYKQDWPTWIQQGWCDRVILMAYTKSTDRLDSWYRMVSEVDPEHQYTVFGLGLHLVGPSSLGGMLDHLGEKGMSELALFSNIQFMESSHMQSAVRMYREKHVAGP